MKPSKQNAILGGSILIILILVGVAAICQNLGKGYVSGTIYYMSSGDPSSSLAIIGHDTCSFYPCVKGIILREGKEIYVPCKGKPFRYVKELPFGEYQFGVFCEDSMFRATGGDKGQATPLGYYHEDPFHAANWHDANLASVVTIDAKHRRLTGIDIFIRESPCRP